jgi:chorismate synthase
MSNIRNYADLLAERERLKNLLQEQKQQIKTDVQELKEELRPAIALLSLLGKFTTRETRNDAIITTGSALAIDMVAKKMLSKNILARILLPGVLKNITSHLLYNAGPWWKKIFNGRKKSQDGMEATVNQ